MTRPTTRLAPSPTGALHLGNARTFMVNWAIARQRGMRLMLRIEDLDGPRVKPGADAMAIEDLLWLGIDWDGAPVYQSHDLTGYRQALQHLYQQGRIYPCACSRRQIQSAQSAPHHDTQELRYPGTCRPRLWENGHQHGDAEFFPWGDVNQAVAWRLIVPQESIQFVDGFCGLNQVHVQQEVGDFVVATKDHLPAYQLAVVVDDARQGVDEVIRGDDLLASTGRQLWLYRFLNLTPQPRYVHLPLVRGHDGRRLAKRHGDTRLVWYRHQGVDRGRVVGLIAWWCGLVNQRRPMTPKEFLNQFSLDRLPRGDVTFTPEDHAWLLGH